MENLNIFCAVTRKYYGVKESPLDEHRDVCHSMHTLVLIEIVVDRKGELHSYLKRLL